MRGAFLEVLSDMLGSIGVIVAGDRADHDRLAVRRPDRRCRRSGCSSCRAPTASVVRRCACCSRSLLPRSTSTTCAAGSRPSPASPGCTISTCGRSRPGCGSRAGISISRRAESATVLERATAVLGEEIGIEHVTLQIEPAGTTRPREAGDVDGAGGRRRAPAHRAGRLRASAPIACATGLANHRGVVGVEPVAGRDAVRGQLRPGSLLARLPRRGGARAASRPRDAAYAHRICRVDGMDCADCAQTIERAVSRVGRRHERRRQLPDADDACRVPARRRRARAHLRPGRPARLPRRGRRRGPRRRSARG